MRKHLTAEAEQWCRERIGQHNDNIKLWESGHLTATEPEQEEREITVAQLRAARDELVSLLCLFCGAVRSDLERLTLKEAMGLVVNVLEKNASLRDRLAKIAAILETAVCTEGCDKGVVLLSDHGTTHREEFYGRMVSVYDHEYFSPLGDALIAAWELTQKNEDAK